MFSTTTMASSTTNPTEMVSAISEILSRLKPQRYITASAPSSDSGTTEARDESDAQIAQEQQDHQHDQRDGERKREFDVMDRGADGLGAVRQDVDADRRRHHRSEPRQRRLDLIDRLDDVGAGLLEHDQEHRALAVVPGAGIEIFGPLDRLADVLDPDRGTIAIGDDDVAIVFRFGELIVGGEREAPIVAVDAALGRIGGCRAEHGAHILEREALRGKLGGIDLNPNAGFCSPPIETCDTPSICEICCARIVSAKSSTTVSGSESECTPMIRIGEFAGLTLR